MVRITALMDDKTSNSACINEHGLSYLVESPAGTLLFDCGQGENTWHNARALGLDLNDVDTVILSHNHYDHAGGLPSLPETGRRRTLYTGSDFFEEKYSFDGNKYHSRGAGFDAAFPESHGFSHQIVRDTTQIAPGIHLIGNFPRVHTFETTPSRYVRKTSAGYIPDDFHDEICMAVDVGGKLAVLVGCAHPGIVNMVSHVHNLLNRPIYAVFGGIHLLDVEESRICATLAKMRDMGVELWA